MDALLSVAVEEIALEGQEGCTVETLWNLLGARLPVGSITFLPPQLQNALWGVLVQRTEDVQFFTMPPSNTCCGVHWNRRAINATEEVPETGGKKGRSTRPKKKADANPMARAIMLSRDDPKITTHAAAAADNVMIAASEAVRMSVLGVYEIQDSRFPLSDMQLAALAAVGRTRWRGTINADLANHLGIAYRNFYYIVKNLETRKLVVKNPVVFAPPGATVTVSSVLHLPRFQPAIKLGPGQMFKTVDAVRGMEVATYVLQDDNMYMRLVCSTIAETAERVVVESDLKLVCGFRGTRGHRLWRRLRRKMEEQGYLAFETCRVRDRLVPCVRLLKDWKVPTSADRDDPEGVGEDADEADADDVEGGNGGNVCIHVTELSLERQLLEGVLSAGSDGVLNHELFSLLGVSSKVYGTKLVDIIKRYNLQVTVVNRGRTVLNRIVAPRELLAAARHLLPPPAAGQQLPSAANEADEGVPKPATQGVAAVAEGAGLSVTDAGRVATGVAPTVLDAVPAGAPGTAAVATAAPVAATKAKTRGKAAATPNSNGKVKAKNARTKDIRKDTGAAGADEEEAAAKVAAAPIGRPRRSAAIKSSKGIAAALKALGGVGTGNDDDDDYAEADSELEAKAAEKSSGSGDELDGEESNEDLTEEMELQEEAQQLPRGRAGASSGHGGGSGSGRGHGHSRPPKRPRLADVAVMTTPLTKPPIIAAVAAGTATPGPVAAQSPAALSGAPAAASAGAGAAAGVAPQAPKERKPHWTKVITLKTEDRLRLLVEHLNKHRFISRVQVRRLVMEWESAASGKPIPNSTAGPDIKTIRRLMDRLAQSGKAKLVRVETPGFLGDNRPIDTLLRPDLEPTPELMDEIRKHMADFERKLRSECCRKALAARKMATMIDYPVGNLLPEAVVAAAAAAGSATAAAVAAATAAKTNHAVAAIGGPDHGHRPVGVAEAINDTTDGLLRAAGLQPGDDEPAARGGGGAAAGGRGAGDGLGGGAQRPAMATSDAVRLRIGRGVSLFRAVHNEATARSVENGLIPAKMVRVRLLHFLIAKLVGLGGFEADPLASVDPDPGGMPHMPLSLGEEVLSLASATERSKMAFAFGAMKGTGTQGDHQRQQKQQQPQMQGQSMAATDGGEGGAGGGGDGPPGGAAPGGAGAAAMGQDLTVPLRHLSVRRLWSIMPLSVALQVLGSTSRRPPEELARLCECGATLGSLTPEQARNIMDGTSVHRLEYLISILRRLRLLEWAVVDRSRLDNTRRIGPGAGARARDGHGIRLLVHGRGVLEIPQGKEVPAAGAAATPGGAAAQSEDAVAGSGGNGTPPVVVISQSGFSGMQGGSGRFVEVDLTTAAGLDEYWRRFEELYRLTGTTHAEVQRLRRCFPATTVPEVLSRNSWHGQRLMAAVQWLKLQAGLEHIDLSDGQQITSLAGQLGIDVDVVARIVSDKRRRLNRVGDAAAEASGAEEGSAGEGMPLRLARLNTGAVMRGQGQSQAASGTPGLTSHEVGEALPAGERRRMMKRRTIRRSSPTARQRRAEEREAEREAKAARKAARVAKRMERDAAKAERRAARAAGTYVVRRRTRAEIEAAEAEAEAEGHPHRKRQRQITKEGPGGEEVKTDGGKEQRQRRKRQAGTVTSAQLAARDKTLAAVGPGRQRLLVASLMSHEGGAAADGAGRRQRRSSDNGSGEAGGNGCAGEEADAAAADDGRMGPRMRMPSMAAPSRMTRILWTASEDRVLLTEYVKLAAETGLHVRLPWKSCSNVLPYSITACIRHVRYLKRNYPSYTGRLDELLRRAYERKVDMARLAERGQMRMAAYRERLRRRQAGEPVGMLGEDGFEVLDDNKSQPPQPRDPLEVTRAIVAATTAGEPVAGGFGAGNELATEVQLLQQQIMDLEAITSAPAAPAAEAEGAAEAGAQPLSGLGENPAEVALMRRVTDADAAKAAAMVMEREAAITEAQALVEDFVLVMPRRISQKKREMMQQRGDLDLGEMPTPTVDEAQTRRRTAAAVRRSLGGALQVSIAETAATAGNAAGAPAAGSSAAAGATTAAAPGSVAPSRSRRIVGGAAARVLLPAVVVPSQLAVARPSVAVTAAMCMLVSLLYRVRAAGGVAAWMSNEVVETLTDFGRRFSADVKTAALKQMQLRGWLARTGPRRQLELTHAFVNRLQGTELPPGLLARCASAASRLDVLLARAAAMTGDTAQQHGGTDETDVDGAAALAPQQGTEAANSAAISAVATDADKAGAEAVERSCTVDKAKGAVALEAQEQLPSELVAVILARQALGRVELLPGTVEMQPEWAGQAVTAGLLVTSVQLLVVPQHSSRTDASVALAPAAAVMGRGGGSGANGMTDRFSWLTIPPPAVGTRVVVEAGSHATTVLGIAPQGASSAAASVQPHGGMSAADKEQQHEHHRRGGVSAALLDHGIGVVTPAGDDLAGSSGQWPSPGELFDGKAPLFRPSAVANDLAIQATAKAACKAHLAAEVPSCHMVMDELLDAVEALLDTAGPDGLTFTDLSSLLNKAASGSVTVGGACIAGATAPVPQAQSTDTAGNGGVATAAESPSPLRMLTLSLPPTQHHVSLVLRALELHGLVRRVGGWDALHFIVTRHCQDSILEVETDAGNTAAAAVAAAAPPRTDTGPSEQSQNAAVGTADKQIGGSDAADAGAGTEGVLGTDMDMHTGGETGIQRCHGQADGSHAPVGPNADGHAGAVPLVSVATVRERVLRPWVDHLGGVNMQMWDTLLQRLLVLVMRHPGISEDLLVASMDVIPPQACRELLHHLAHHGHVEVRKTPPLPKRPRRPLLLGGGGSHVGGLAAAPTVHYFPVLEHYAGSTLLKVPAP
ncbi:hypothetical protein VaNZ11_000551 [Volvox africanus]|uniref:B-block binding subunit of TFIIIC domain-containing protein n=1 Tax=Volvox africanus TaxID=51714 RepID=A0ABQ5RNB0_9CHLO|nr:hypothetical protein VaNZ11_000551 [Volvox africanus]